MKALKTLKARLALAAGVLLVPGMASAADKLNSGDTAWMITATVLVLFMTLPGLILFYGGMVRSKNVLSVLMQGFAVASLMTILWVVAGYSIAFGNGGEANAFWGGLDKMFLKGMTVESLSGTIPETVFMTFQMTFAIITPVLIVGAFAERMKFSAMLIFLGIWMLVVYAPITHWVWGGGLLSSDGVKDFAGGTVVHINAGVAGLVAALVIGKRKGYPTTPMPPHNLTLTVIGAAMLWVGWFGFNAGSQLAADGGAGMAMAVTQIATAAAALAWMFAEWISHGKPSVLGIVTGAIGGLVAITPAAGFVGPMGALAIGAASGIICFFGATTLKRKLGYDDSLDAFGVHGIGGIVGALLTGVFCAESLGGSGFSKITEGGKEVVLTMGQQVGAQAYSVIVTIAYTAIATLIILKVIDVLIGLRVSEDEEVEGLDITQHDERGYNL